MKTKPEKYRLDRSIDKQNSYYSCRKKHDPHNVYQSCHTYFVKMKSLFCHRCIERAFKFSSKKRVLFDDQFKDCMPDKNTANDLQKELAYCKEVEKRIENK